MSALGEWAESIAVFKTNFLEAATKGTTASLRLNIKLVDGKVKTIRVQTDEYVVGNMALHDS